MIFPPWLGCTGTHTTVTCSWQLDAERESERERERDCLIDAVDVHLYLNDFELVSYHIVP